MKIVKILIIFVVLSIFQLNVFAKSLNDFRNTNWDLSKQKVKSIEKFKLYNDEPEKLFYSGKFLDFPVNVVYIFQKNKLSNGIYVFDQSYDSFEPYIKDFNKVKKGLIKLLGKPLSDTTVWTDNFYKNNPKKLVSAFTLGHVSFFTEWLTKTTRILVSFRINSVTFFVHFALSVSMVLISSL